MRPVRPFTTLLVGLCSLLVPLLSSTAEPLTPCVPSDLLAHIKPKALDTALKALETIVTTACPTECAHCFDVLDEKDGSIKLSVKGAQSAPAYKADAEAFVVVDASTGAVLRSGVMFLTGRPAAPHGGT